VRGAAQQAILAALEHGSHTVGELTVVTAMSGQNIRENLRRMLSSGVVTRARREGKAAYALAGGAGH
jgi:DNA-binding transcriptional ArsR family regulator